MIVKNRKAGGSITVFLSLTLVIIMALLGTMIEVTRGKTCRIQARRVMKLASDSLMTEYSRPLFEKYNLYFLENEGKAFADSITEYASGKSEYNSLFPHSMDVYLGTLERVTVDGERYAGDDGGAALREQIVSYMKRRISADKVNAFLRKTDEMQPLSDSAEEIEQKAKQEKEAVGECRSVLELMRLIDGVDCSGGAVKGQKYFVKMLFTGEKKPGKFGISEAVVWNAVKKKVSDVSDFLNHLQEEAKRREFAVLVRETLEKTKEALRIVTEMGAPRLKKMNVSGDAACVLSSNRGILEKTGEMLSQEMTEQTAAELKRMWKAYDVSGIVFDYAGINEKGGAESPMSVFSDAVSGGLAKLVFKKDFNISNKSVKDADHYHSLYAADKSEKKKEEDGVAAFAKEEEVDFQGVAKGFAKTAVSDVMLCEYLKRYFSSVQTKVGANKRLDYEWEYILCGKGSDKKNLETVINRLVLLRSVINTAALLSSSEKRETAYAAALAVVGFTGMEPLIRFTQTLFLVLWGMTESLVEVAALLQGKKVPVIKTAKDIVVKFPELYRIGQAYIMEKADRLPKKNGRCFGYTDYVLLLMAGIGRDVRYHRMMDLMEWNIRDHEYSGFRFGQCVDSFKATGQFSYETKLFRLPLIQRMTGWEGNGFQQEVTVDAGYVAK